MKCALIIAHRGMRRKLWWTALGRPCALVLWPAANCLEKTIARRIADGREIRKASKAGRGEGLIPVPLEMAVKAALYLAVSEAGIVNAELARELGCHKKEVRRMLDPRPAPSCWSPGLAHDCAHAAQVALLAAGW